jgi:hypothetical protein
MMHADSAGLQMQHDFSGCVLVPWPYILLCIPFDAAEIREPFPSLFSHREPAHQFADSFMAAGAQVLVNVAGKGLASGSFFLNLRTLYLQVISPAIISPSGYTLVNITGDHSHSKCPPGCC